MARVLIIEDDPASRELLAYLLEAAGHVAITAEDGPAGVAAAIEGTPDLVLCDIGLPGMGGVDVLIRLRREEALDDVSVVAVTAFAMVGDREQLLLAGFDGYISKPIDPERFIGQVSGFLTASSAPAVAKARAKAGTASVPKRAPSTPRRRRLIVVDDSAANLDLIATILGGVGYEVETTQSIDHALDRARARRPDLLLTDVHMKPRDGFDVVAALRADPKLRTVRVGLISSSVWGERDRKRAKAFGVAGFLIRPLDPETLAEAVGRMLDGGWTQSGKPARPARTPRPARPARSARPVS
jgi:two-component system cell cycle response regulator